MAGPRVSVPVARSASTSSIGISPRTLSHTENLRCWGSVSSMLTNHGRSPQGARLRSRMRCSRAFNSGPTLNAMAVATPRLQIFSSSPELTAIASPSRSTVTESCV